MKSTLTIVAIGATALLTGVACNSSSMRHRDTDTVSGSTSPMAPSRANTNDNGVDILDPASDEAPIASTSGPVTGNAQASPVLLTPAMAPAAVIAPVAPAPIAATTPVTGNAQTAAPTAPIAAIPVTKHARVLPKKHVARHHVAKKAKKKSTVVAAAPAKKVVRKHRRTAVLAAPVVAPKRTMTPKRAVASNSVPLASGANYQVIDFAPGSDQLNDGAKASLRSLIDTAKANNEIKKVDVAAWSDESYPAGKAKLSKTERALAKRRLASINTYLKDELNVRGIADYNMAEKSNFFSRAFKTKDAALKSLFAKKGAPANVRPEEFNIVKKEGGPEKAVVLLQTRQLVASNAVVGRTTRTTTVAVAPIAAAPVSGNAQTRATSTTVSGSTSSASSVIGDDNSNLDRNGYRKHSDNTGTLWFDSMRPTSEELLKQE